MNDEIMVTPAVIGTTTSANPAENTKVSGISLHLRFFTAAARYPGRRKTTQHGANKATAPAKKAAINPQLKATSPRSAHLITCIAMMVLIVRSLAPVFGSPVINSMTC